MGSNSGLMYIILALSHAECGGEQALDERVAATQQLTPQERCLALRNPSYDVSQPSQSRQPPNRLFWVHIPKGGTSFGLAMLFLACPQLPQSAAIGSPPPGTKHLDKLSLMAVFVKKYNLKRICGPNALETQHSIFGHFPLQESTSHSQRGVILLRHPGRRLYSAFRSLHADGMPKELVVSLRNGKIKTAEQYAQFPGIKGCQVKMLTGRRCAALYDPTEADLKLAIEKLESAFAFVGLTDHYDLSVCLMHAMLGGTPRYNSFVNTRPTSLFATKYSANDSEKYLPMHVVAELDPIDTALYNAARDIFISKLAEHEFDIPTDLSILSDRRQAVTHLENREIPTTTVAHSAPLILILCTAILVGLLLKKQRNLGSTLNTVCPQDDSIITRKLYV